jgi:ABC-type Fe3+-siderophore transport system permease subunit
MKKILITSLIILITPFSAGAQFGLSITICGLGSSRLCNLIDFFLELLNNLIPILIGLAVLLFIWGLLKYIRGDGEEAKKEGIKVVGYGIVSIFVMVSLWGIIHLIGSVLGIDINGVGGYFLGENKVPKNINVDTEIIKPKP